MLRIRGVIKDLSDDQIKTAIIKQNGKLLKDIPQEDLLMNVQRKISSSKKEICGIVLEVSQTLWHALRDQKIKVGYQVVSVSDQSPIVQCYKCLKIQTCNESLQRTYYMWALCRTARHPTVPANRESQML